MLCGGFGSVLSCCVKQLNSSSATGVAIGSAGPVAPVTVSAADIPALAVSPAASVVDDGANVADMLPVPVSPAARGT